MEQGKKHLMVIFAMTFQFFFSLGELSAITYSVPEGINYSLELIVCISYSELLDAMPWLGASEGGSHGVSLPILSPLLWSSSGSWWEHSPSPARWLLALCMMQPRPCSALLWPGGSVARRRQIASLLE